MAFLLPLGAIAESGIALFSSPPVVAIATALGLTSSTLSLASNLNKSDLTLLLLKEAVEQMNFKEYMLKSEIKSLRCEVECCCKKRPKKRPKKKYQITKRKL